MKNPEGSNTTFIYGACKECVAKTDCKARQAYEQYVVVPASRSFTEVQDEVNRANTELIDNSEVKSSINRRWSSYRSRVMRTQVAFERAVDAALRQVIEAEPMPGAASAYEQHLFLLQPRELRKTDIEITQIMDAAKDINEYAERGICGAWELEGN